MRQKSLHVAAVERTGASMLNANCSVFAGT